MAGRKVYDMKQDKKLMKKGYTIVRFTETEIKQSPENCLNKIAGVL